MGIHKLNIQEFLLLSKDHPVFDVRSPAEYLHAHIPGANSLPLFSDTERASVGIAYKQQSRKAAIKIGLDFFGVKMRKMVEEVEGVCSDKPSLKSKDIVLVHCWRGGMRSAGVAWLLDLYGFKVYTLVGGYKVYRNWVLKQFDKSYKFNILGGYTGSGKTIVLHQMDRKGETVINLEGLANHKGSAFGALGEKPQPGQEMFENLLATNLFFKTQMSDPNSATDKMIWLEDESQRIGSVNIPFPIWSLMRKSMLFFIEISFEKRLQYLVQNYGEFKRELLVGSIMRIQKKLGGLETKNAINYLLENNISECFRILLSYYDKLYTKGLNNRENLEEFLHKVVCTSVDADTNANQIKQVLQSALSMNALNT